MLVARLSGAEVRGAVVHVEDALVAVIVAAIFVASMAISEKIVIETKAALTWLTPVWSRTQTPQAHSEPCADRERVGVCEPWHWGS
jgi:hypothetical protein